MYRGRGRCRNWLGRWRPRWYDCLTTGNWHLTFWKVVDKMFATGWISKSTYFWIPQCQWPSGDSGSVPPTIPVAILVIPDCWALLCRLSCSQSSIGSRMGFSIPIGHWHLRPISTNGDDFESPSCGTFLRRFHLKPELGAWLQFWYCWFVCMLTLWLNRTRTESLWNSIILISMLHRIHTGSVYPMVSSIESSRPSTERHSVISLCDQGLLRMTNSCGPRKVDDANNLTRATATVVYWNARWGKVGVCRWRFGYLDGKFQ